MGRPLAAASTGSQGPPEQLHLHPSMLSSPLKSPNNNKVRRNQGRDAAKEQSVPAHSCNRDAEAKAGAVKPLSSTAYVVTKGGPSCEIRDLQYVSVT